MKLKKICEKSFEILAQWSYRHHWLAIFTVLCVFLGLAWQLPQLTMDTSNESFFHKDDKVLIDYNEFRNQFGKDEFIVIAIGGNDIFSLQFLGKVKNLHNEIEQSVPYLDKITSIINVRNTRGVNDDLIVEDFLENWPQNSEDLVELKKRAQQNSLYENYILNKDITITTIIIKPLPCNPDSEELLQEEGSCQPMTNVQNTEMIESITPLLQKYHHKDFSLTMSGLPVVIETLNQTLEKDLNIIIPMIFLMVAVFLALLFRRVTGVVYPIIIFLLSLISAIGIMAWLRIPMSNVTTILPSFLLVVSISDSVHILALFYPIFQKTKDKEKAIIAAMGHSGLPILMTSLTTAGGLLSFAVAKIAPIADLGIVIPVSVFLALFYTVFLLPALIAILPVKIKEKQQHRANRLNSFFDFLAQTSCSRQKTVITLFLTISVVAGIGIGKLRFEHNALKWFAEDSPIRLATEKIDKEMSGTISFDVVIDTGVSDGLYDISFINALEEAATKFANYTSDNLFVGKVISLATVLKETNRALHNNDEQEYRIPGSKELVAQELLLFQLSGSDDLEELVDQQLSKTRFTMHLPYRDTSRYKKYVKDVETDLRSRFPNCSITTTGVNALFVEILNNVMTTMARSYSIALVIISLLMIAMLGRLRMGLISMVPNLIPIFYIMGLMGWLGIPLDFGTVLIGSITIGLVVDDTIHFLHNFSKYYDIYGDPEKATATTLKTVGRAMMVTSIVLVGGFLCNTLSDLSINVASGILIASTILAALITDFLLAPAILSLIYTKKEKTSRQLCSQEESSLQLHSLVN